MTKNKQLYLIGLLLLAIAVATPFVIDVLNPWPSVKRLGATILITGFVFAACLALYLKKKEDLK